MIAALETMAIALPETLEREERIIVAQSKFKIDKNLKTEKNTYSVDL